MSCCLSVYFLVVFKTVLKGLWMFGFIGLKIVFWVLFVELSGLLTPFVTRLSLAMFLLLKTCVASAHGDPICFCFSLSPSPSVLPSPSTLGLSTFRYTAIKRTLIVDSPRPKNQVSLNIYWEKEEKTRIHAFPKGVGRKLNINSFV